MGSTLIGNPVVMKLAISRTARPLALVMEHRLYISFKRSVRIECFLIALVAHLFPFLSFSFFFAGRSPFSFFLLSPFFQLYSLHALFPFIMKFTAILCLLVASLSVSGLPIAEQEYVLLAEIMILSLLTPASP